MKTNTLLLALFSLVLIIGCKPAQQAQVQNVVEVGRPDKDGYVELTPALIQSLGWNVDSLKKAPYYFKDSILFSARFTKIEGVPGLAIVRDTTVIISPKKGEKYRRMEAIEVSDDGKDIWVCPKDDKTRRKIEFSVADDGRYHCLISNVNLSGDNFNFLYGNQKYNVSKKVNEYVLFTRVKYMGSRY